jgi:hypothetical protein
MRSWARFKPAQFQLLLKECSMSRAYTIPGLLLPVALVLAACGGGAPGGQHSAAQPAAVANADACGALTHSDRIGQKHAQYDFSAQNRTVRLLGPDTPMTMDYRTDRLNVDTDGAGRITRIWCG